MLGDPFQIELFPIFFCNSFKLFPILCAKNKPFLYFILMGSVWEEGTLVGWWLVPQNPK
jgi:hypothetical protein